MLLFLLIVFIFLLIWAYPTKYQYGLLTEAHKLGNRLGTRKTKNQQHQGGVIQLNAFVEKVSVKFQKIFASYIAMLDENSKHIVFAMGQRRHR